MRISKYILNRWLTAVGLFLLALSPLQAQNSNIKDDYQAEQEYEDESDFSEYESIDREIDRRGFDDDKIREFQEDDRFDYFEEEEDTPVREGPTLIQQLLSRIWAWLRKAMDARGPVTTNNVILWIIAFIVVGVSIFLLAKSDLSLLFKRSGKKTELTYSIEDEDIHGIDFEEEIRTAKKEKQYRKAIRLMYLYALKQLSDQELIYWEIGKTNYEYQRELIGKEAHQPFAALSRSFMYAWYGNLPVSPQEFLDIEEDYMVLSNQLKGGRRA